VPFLGSVLRERRNRQGDRASLYQPDNLIDALLLAVAADRSPLLDIDAAGEFESASTVRGPGYEPMDYEFASNQLHKSADAWNDRSFEQSASGRDVPNFNG
jgi:hypothetical protein